MTVVLWVLVFLWLSGLLISVIGNSVRITVMKQQLDRLHGQLAADSWQEEQDARATRATQTAPTEDSKSTEGDSK